MHVTYGFIVSTDSVVRISLLIADFYIMKVRLLQTYRYLLSCVHLFLEQNINQNLTMQFVEFYSQRRQFHYTCSAHLLVAITMLLLATNRLTEKQVSWGGDFSVPHFSKQIIAFILTGLKAQNIQTLKIKACIYTYWFIYNNCKVFSFFRSYIFRPQIEAICRKL